MAIRIEFVDDTYNVHYRTSSGHIVVFSRTEWREISEFAKSNSVSRGEGVFRA